MIDERSFSTEFAGEALKGAPPVAVAATTLAGAIDWQTWVFILTAFYVLLQILWLVWKFADKLLGKKVEGDG